MTMVKKIFYTLLLTALPWAANAQSNGSNSSYSRFGLGTLCDQSQGYTRAMGGVSQGVRGGSIINMQNPASYSATDSLAFILDAGMSLSFGHLSQKNTSINVRNTSLTHVNAAFRVVRGLGMSFGFVPYSNIGYNFQSEKKVGTNQNTSQKITAMTTYYGNGGIHQAYIGAGWNPIHMLSIGANISYLWGDYSHSLAQQFYEGKEVSTNYSSMNQEITSDFRTYKIDLGVQYPIRLTGQDWLTIGATASLGHKVGSEATMTRYTSVHDTIQCTNGNAFELPYTYGAGLSWRHGANLLVAADVVREQWDGCRLPVSGYTGGGDIDLLTRTDQYMNRTKVALGAEYTPDPYGRRFLQCVQYKVGANYSTPYMKVDGQDGPREFNLTAGFGIPLSKSRSIINVSAQWTRRVASSKNLISENYLMLNVGLTFNEGWFMKWKIR